MSKERLEETKEKYLSAPIVEVIDEIDYILISTDDKRWLIEQAERVHGKNHLMGLAGMYEDCNRMVGRQHHKILRLQRENKRLREAIEMALGESGWGDEGNALYRTIGILTKALEGEK